MANPTTGLFQSLVAGMSRASANLTYENAFIDAIFWDYKPVVATPQTELVVVIPTVDEADVTDIGSGALNVTDTDHNVVRVPYDKHFSTSFVIKTWDQNRTPQELERTYLTPRLEALKRKINRSIALVANTTNFGTGATPIPGYALITGGTAVYLLRADIGQGWTQMVNNGVPMDDQQNLFLITSPAVYAGMLGDTTMSYQYITGLDTAVAAQQRAKLAIQWGASVRYDQHYSQLAVTNGFTASHGPSILMHRYAIAGVTSQPPPSDNPAVRESISWIGNNNIPVQMQVGYSMEKQGTLVHLHCYWGVKAARPDFASLIQTA